jgi:hypothetical protein
MMQVALRHKGSTQLSTRLSPEWRFCTVKAVWNQHNVNSLRTGFFPPEQKVGRSNRPGRTSTPTRCDLHRRELRPSQETNPAGLEG